MDVQTPGGAESAYVLTIDLAVDVTIMRGRISRVVGIDMLR